MKIKVAVCDNERFALDTICNAVSKAFSQEGIEADIFSYTDFVSLRKAIAGNNFDLLMLDIDMEQRTNGIDFAKALRQDNVNTDIIYISNCENLVFEAFQVQPLGFIRKNCFFKDLNRYVPLIVEKLSRPASEDQIVLSCGSDVATVPLSEIIYVEGALKKQTFHMARPERTISVQMTMRTLETLLCQHHFIRIHNGYIVNCEHIAKVNNEEVILKTGQCLPISRGKSQETRKEYFEYLKDIGALNS